jgi:predicted alpha/beta-hydrolase family hydrolase
MSETNAPMKPDGSIHDPFVVAGDPPVRGVLHRAAEGDAAIVLTHGAGANADAALLRALARAFAADGVSALRCDLPFRQARASGPPSPAGAARDRHGLAAALGALAARSRFVGGHSYGGRQASMLLAESSHLAAGLLLLSYPLHPPGKPERRRIEHLPALRVPTLFVHGDRDPFGTPEEIEAARALIPAPTSLLVIPRSAHALHADATTALGIVAAFRRLVRGD